MSKNPKISICIPTYNRADLLNQTLQSVELQTIRPYEVLVVDNCSQDNTESVVKKYKSVHYIKNKKNIGMVENWNRCIRLARGEYIAFLHSDDLIAPSWYEIWQKTIKKNRFKFYTSSLIIIDENNNYLHVYHTFKGSRVIKQPVVIREFWAHLLPGIAPYAGNIYHKSIFKDIGLYDKKYHTESDFIHSVKILSKYDVYYLDKLLFAYRSHKSQGFDFQLDKKNLKEEVKRVDNYFQILNYLYKKEIKVNNRSRYFIQIPIFMTLSAVSFYIVKLKFTKIFMYFAVARRNFPDLFSKLSDWLIYSKLLLIFSYRILFKNFISKEDKQNLQWLKYIKANTMI